MSFGADHAVLAYRPAAWLKVTGEDAGSYLQGQFSQDLRGLAGGGSAYGLLLNHKGRIQADGFIVKEGPEAFWIMSYECKGEALRARLESYIVADDVAVEDLTADWSGLSIFYSAAIDETPAENGSGRRGVGEGLDVVGAGTLAASGGPVSSATPGVQLPEVKGDPAVAGPALANTAPSIRPPLGVQTQSHPLLSAATDGTRVVAFRGRRGAGECWEYVFPIASAEVERDLRARLGFAREERPEFWLRARIAAGIPSVPRDAGPSDLPQEVGLVADAVSFTKGCYLGQEIMARLKTRGRVRRQLRRVRVEGLPAGASVRRFGVDNPSESGSAPGTNPPIILFQGDRPVGELRSWVLEGAPLGPFLALAMLPADAPPDCKYALAAGAPPVIALTVL